MFFFVFYFFALLHNPLDANSVILDCVCMQIYHTRSKFAKIITCNRSKISRICENKKHCEFNFRICTINLSFEQQTFLFVRIIRLRMTKKRESPIQLNRSQYIRIDFFGASTVAYLNAVKSYATQNDWFLFSCCQRCLRFLLIAMICNLVALGFIGFST